MADLQYDAYCSPSTSASSLSAVDPPVHPADPWLAPWMAPYANAQPSVQLQLPDIETLPIQRPLLLADDPYKAQQSLLYAVPDPASLIIPTAPCDYPTSVYAPRVLQLALHPVQLPAPAPVPLPPALSARAPAPAQVSAPAELPIACPTPLHAYNKFDALLDFDPDDLLRHDALRSKPTRPRQPTAVSAAPAPPAPPAAHNPVAPPTQSQSQHRRKRPHDACEPEPVSPRSKRARRSLSGLPERYAYPAAGATPAVAREALPHAPAPRARRAPSADRPHPRALHHAPHCYSYTPSAWNHPSHAHALAAQRPAR
ncbi:hypothetical protein AURDEDRAFT_145174 [Auricularia subglabra TFB-10046 SS5]|nr:hypothetical protein AURDEDRAFT_145174 [Auricularia subglabra TFB-10046 SS5]